MSDAKKTIVEEILTDRNFKTQEESTQKIAEEIRKGELIEQNPILSDSRVGSVRIIGGITPEKLQLARDFEMMFNAATSEIEELAAYKPDDKVMALVKNGHIDEARMAEMKGANIGTLFKVENKFLIKTADNKLEEVKDYVFRLERAVLTQIQIRKQSEEKASNTEKFLQEKLDEAVKNNEFLRAKFDDIKTRVSKKLPEVFGKDKTSVTRSQLWFHMRPFSRRIKAALLKLFTEEKSNG